MAKRELLVFATFVALVFCTEIEDSEQKKRGVSKGTTLNTITSGAQKQDYNTYSIYPQDQNPPNTQSTYQATVPNSFYPTQENSQYYSSPNSQAASYQPQQQHINAVPQTPSQFVPLNFIPNSGYQSKYQIVPGKANGIQLAFVQPPSTYQSPPLPPYSPSFFSPNPPNPQLVSPGHFGVPQNYQPFGGSYLSHPSTMLFFAPPNPSLYSNLLYQNPAQNFYYPTQKYNGPYSPASNEYDKLQASQNQKEDNDIGQSSQYAVPTDSTSSYKSAYAASRNTYAKI